MSKPVRIRVSGVPPAASVDLDGGALRITSPVKATSWSFAEPPDAIDGLDEFASWIVNLIQVVLVVMFVVLCGLVIFGCGPSHHGDAMLGARLLTPRGTPVQFPRAFDRFPGFEAACLAEIDSTTATSVPGDPVWPSGVPEGWTVSVELPAFVVNLPDGPLAVQGETVLADRLIRVGSRSDASSPILLPALAWELGNARRGAEPKSVLEGVPPLPGGSP